MLAPRSHLNPPRPLLALALKPPKPLHAASQAAASALIERDAALARVAELEAGQRKVRKRERLRRFVSRLWTEESSGVKTAPPATVARIRGEASLSR